MVVSTTLFLVNNSLRKIFAFIQWLKGHAQELEILTPSLHSTGIQTLDSHLLLCGLTTILQLLLVVTEERE